LLRPIDNAPPTIPTLGVDPRTGQVTTRSTDDPRNPNPSVCERDRIALGNLDDAATLRDIEGEANRANTSFYPIDPRGLVVFDEQIVPSAGVGVGVLANPTVAPVEDRRRMDARRDSLRELADATDGLAVVGTTNIAAGLRRIADDVSAYYLLGYYSTGKLDGKFHTINVRVKRPGVDVRARRGFLAAAAPAATSTASGSPPTAAPSNARDLEAALASLSALAGPRSLLLHVAAGWTSSQVARVWIVAESVSPATASGTASRALTSEDIEAYLTDSGGATVAITRARIEPGAQSTLFSFALPTLSASGDYTVTARSRSTATGASIESAPVRVGPSPSSTGAVFFRRGPATGNRDVATADRRFRRSDRLRVEIPDPSAGTVTARLLDRRGESIAVPVAGSLRDDQDGVRWLVAELALAPLAPADYAVEVVSGSGRRLIAFRVIP